MKMIKVMVALVLLATFPAYADSTHTTTGGTTEVNATSNVDVNSTNIAIAQGGAAYSLSGGGAGGEGGAGGAGGAANAVGGSASNSGNAQAVHFDQIRQSPSVFMNSPAPTAPCQATVGGFLSFIAGAGISGSYTLDNCEIREEARIAYGVGQPEIAKKILCMGKYASKTDECKAG